MNFKACQTKLSPAHATFIMIDLQDKVRGFLNYSEILYFPTEELGESFDFEQPFM